MSKQAQPARASSPFSEEASVSDPGYESLDSRPPQNASQPLFGVLFQRITEAVGATRELLYDAELRKKAVPFVLAEGGKAWNEIQKGLTRNAQALSRQLQHGAAGQFQAYIGRLLERTTSRRVLRADQYYQNVSVWVGRNPCHDMPQEVRTRFWFVLLENPHLINLLQPISSRELLSSIVRALPKESKDAFSNAFVPPAAPPMSHTQLTSSTSALGTSRHPSEASVHTPPGQPANTTANDRPLISLDDDSNLDQPHASSTVVQAPTLGCTADLVPQPVAVSTRDTDAGSISINNVSSVSAGQQSIQTSESTHAPLTTAHADPSSYTGTANTALTPQVEAGMSGVPASGSEGSKTTVAASTAAGTAGSTTGGAGTAPADCRSRLSEEVVEDDVMSMLAARQQIQQQQPSSQQGALVDSLPKKGSFGSLLQRAVDKGRSVAAAVRSSTPLKDAAAAAADSDAAAAAASSTPPPSSQRVAAIKQHAPESARFSSSGTPSTSRLAITGGTGAASQRGSFSKQQAPVPMFTGGDGEWELLDDPDMTASQDPEDTQGQALSRMQEELWSCHQQKSPLEEVWRLMLDVPWDKQKGELVMVPQAECRYLTLNEMTAGQEEVDDVIMRDIHRTFPEHPFFSDHRGQMALFRLLKAYSLHDLEVGYCQGMAFAAGVMLMYLPEEPAFRLYCQLMSDEGPNLRRLYLPGLEELKAELARFEQLLSATQPAVQAHLEAFSIPPVLYVSQWLMTAYASPFPPAFCAELIDIMIQDGHDSIMMRLALSIMDELAAPLLRLHDFEALLTYIKVTPMEWDNLHLRQVLSRAVTHTWSGAESSVFSPAATVSLKSHGAHGNSGVDLLGLYEQDPSAGTTPADERTSVDAAGVHAIGPLPDCRLVGVMDAEELQLDQEIAQMVRDLKLRIPSAHTNDSPLVDSEARVPSP